MSPRDVTDLMQRLAGVERELAANRQELGALRTTVQHMRAARRIAHALGSGALAIALGAGFAWTTTHAQGGNQTVIAPFDVTDSSGATVMRVVGDGPERGISLYRRGTRGAAGEKAAVLITGDGAVSLQSSNGYQATLSVDDTGPRVVLSADSNQTTLFSATKDSVAMGKKGIVKVTERGLTVGDGNYTAVKVSATGGYPGVTVYNGRGNVAAQLVSVAGAGWIGARDGKSTYGKSSAMWMDADGDGNLEVQGKDGETAAGLFTSAKGSLFELAGSSGVRTSEVSSYNGFRAYDQATNRTIAEFGSVHYKGFRAFNSSGQAVVELSGATESGFGKLWLANAAGVGIVEAGQITDGTGVVAVGPSFATKGVGIATFIKGHK